MPTEPTHKPEWAMGRKELEAHRAGTPRRRRWPLVLGGLVAVGVVGAVVMMLSGGSSPDQAAETAPAPVVMQLTPSEISVIAPQHLQRTVRVTGSLRPLRQVQLSAQVSGPVTSVSVRPGDAVKAGDELIQIDVRNLELTLAQQQASANAARAQLGLARSKLTRATTLADRSLTSKSELEASQSNVDNLEASLAASEAQVDAARVAIENARITAPFDGVVAARSVDPGQIVNNGTALMTVVDMSVLEMEALAPIVDSNQIAVGQKVSVAIDGPTASTAEAEVSRISPVGTQNTRQLPVYLSLDNANGKLRGGMFAIGRIVVGEQENAIAVPVSALRHDSEGDHVLVIADGKATRRPITIGARWDGGRVLEIASGLAEGDTVITADLSQIEHGTPVAVFAE